MTRSSGFTPRWGRAAIDEEAARLLRAEDLDHETASEKPLDPIPQHTRFCRLACGPAEPRPHVVRPTLPFLQQWPTNLANRLPSRPITKTVLVGAFFTLWLAAFTLPLAASHRPTKDPDGDYVRNLNRDDTLWTERCGLNGEQCRPFTGSHFSFRCPANCARTTSPTPHPVGPLDVVGRPLVVGSNPFRADSHICAAALLTSASSDARGGCGRVTRVGEHKDFVARDDNNSVVASVYFDSYFPYAFTVSPDPELPCDASADPRALLGVSLLFSAAASLFAPLGTAAAQFFVAFAAAFAHVGFVSDPPPVAPFTVSVLPDLASSFTKRFLPAMALAAVLYRVCARRTLEGLEAPLERLVLWLGGLWVGALANYTSDWVPAWNWRDDDSLGAASRPALVLAAGVVVVGAAVAWQTYCLWAEGRLRRHAIFYAATAASILGLAWVPSIELQAHPYIIALLLLPATAMQTRASLLIQGLLLGILINGVAHSGFLPPLVPRAHPSLSPIPYPTAQADPVISWTPSGANITLAFDPPPSSLFADGLNVTVNDVERFRLVYAEAGRTGETFTWGWSPPHNVKYDEYIRYGFVRDGKVLGYGGADTWREDGSFERAGEGL